MFYPLIYIMKNDTKEALLSKGRFLVEKAYQLESLDKIPTINNNVQWVTINNQQEIKTNIYTIYNL